MGCMDLSQAFVIPLDAIQQILPYLNTTETEKGEYWHIHIIQSHGDNYQLLVPKGSSNLDLTPYLVDLREDRA